jgi:hypothetical protein
VPCTNIAIEWAWGRIALLLLPVFRTDLAAGDRLDDGAGTLLGTAGAAGRAGRPSSPGSDFAVDGAPVRIAVPSHCDVLGVLVGVIVDGPIDTM